jgi:hypothetical protein
VVAGGAVSSGAFAEVCAVADEAAQTTAARGKSALEVGRGRRSKELAPEAIAFTK